LRKILIICTAFSPENAIGSVRLTKLVKYLTRLGWNITVISPELDNNVKVDNTLIIKELNDIKHIKIPYSDLFYNVLMRKRNNLISSTSASDLIINNKKNLKSSIKALLYKNIHSIYNSIRNKDWRKQVINHLKKDTDLRDFDFVYSSYPSISAHLIAEYALEKDIAKKWVAEFRDFMAYKELDSNNEYNKKIVKQKHICQTADIIVGVSESLTEVLRGMSKDLLDRPKPTYCIPNGYDYDDYQDIKINFSKDHKKNDKLCFTYTGSLYGGKRNIEALFKAISELVKNNEIDINHVQFNYAGKEFTNLQKQAAKFNLCMILKDYGYIQRSQSLMLQKQADFVVVATWNTKEERGVNTGKLFESFLIKRPIIAIVTGNASNSEIAQIITSTNTGITYEEANSDVDYKKLTKYIKNQYNRKISGLEVEYDPKDVVVEKYNYLNLTKELEQAILQN